MARTSSPPGLSVRVASLDAAADATRTIAECRELLATLEDQRDGPERQVMQALVHAAAAEALRTLGDLRKALEHALQARALADACGDVEARARSLLAIAHIETQSGHTRQARRHLEELESLEGASSGDRLRARMNIASTLRAEGRLREAATAFESLQDLVVAVDPALAAAVHINAASCYQQLDRIDDARDALDRASKLLPTRSRPDLHAWADTIRAWTEARAGNADLATGLASSVLAPDRQGTDLAIRASAVRALAAAALADGRADALGLARHWLEQLLAEAKLDRSRPDVAHLQESLATICEQQGDLCAAVAHLRDGREVEQAVHRDNERARLQQEALRMELIRMQVEADALRAHKDQLAEANRALLASDSARARMLRTLAHDLRSPLTRILAVADMVDPTDPDAVRTGMADLADTVERMVAMLDDALAPPDPSSFAPIDLRDLVHQSARSFRGLAARKDQRIAVTTDADTTLRTDPVSISRLIDNLLSNALKYSPAGSRIDVALTSRPDRIDLRVMDQGPGFPGIDPSEGLLYGKQLTNRTTGGEQSWGLGLHTVYRLLAELGGFLSLGNREEGGAMVRVTLPRS